MRVIADSSSLSTAMNLELLWADLVAPSTVSDQGIYNWVGDYYAPDSFPALPEPGWTGPRHPEPVSGDGFRGGPIEWAAFALALKLALAGFTELTLVECGSSQGLWALPWIRLASRMSEPTDRRVRAVAFEGSPSMESARTFWSQQSLEYLQADNGFDFVLAGTNWQFDWRQRAVVAQRGPVYFPKIDVRTDNGASAAYEAGATDVRGHPVEYEQVHGVVLEDVVEEFGRIAFLHVDIQGAELGLLETGGFKSVRGNADVIMLGCHSRGAEQLAIEAMPELGYALIAEEPVRFRGRGKPTLLVDGEQLWITRRAHAQSMEMGLVLPEE